MNEYTFFLSNLTHAPGLKLLKSSLGCSWLNLCLKTLATSICLYKIILHQVQSKSGLERCPVNSCNCYANLKKEKNKQNMAQKIVCDDTVYEVLFFSYYFFNFELHSLVFSFLKHFVFCLQTN